jgi:predicted HTH transcriptional regulator
MASSRNGEFEYTENELIQVLTAELERQHELAGADGYMSSEELAEALGWTHDKAQKQLRKLSKRGMLEVSKKQKINMAQRISTVPAYRLKVGSDDS